MNENGWKEYLDKADNAAVRAALIELEPACIFWKAWRDEWRNEPETDIKEMPGYAAYVWAEQTIDRCVLVLADVGPRFANGLTHERDGNVTIVRFENIKLVITDMRSRHFPKLEWRIE